MRDRPTQFILHVQRSVRLSSSICSTNLNRTTQEFWLVAVPNFPGIRRLWSNRCSKPAILQSPTQPVHNLIHSRSRPNRSTSRTQQVQLQLFPIHHPNPRLLNRPTSRCSHHSRRLRRPLRRSPTNHRLCQKDLPVSQIHLYHLYWFLDRSSCRNPTR